MNNATFSGRLATDVAYYPAKKEGGSAVARYNVALDHRKDDETVFVTCVAFGKGADFAKNNLSKGRKYMFSAHIQAAHDKDGKANGLQFAVENVDFIEPKSAGQADVE